MVQIKQWCESKSVSAFFAFAVADVEKFNWIYQNDDKEKARKDSVCNCLLLFFVNSLETTKWRPDAGDGIF